MIGIPADLALASEPWIALAFGTDTASPSTFCETAASISCACFCGSLFDGLQMSLTPESLAACSAPFLTTDQNEPSSECVTIAMVSPLPCVCSTVPDADEPLLLLELPFSSLLLLPQPAASRAATTRQANSTLASSRFIAGTPSLSSEPVWTGTRCSFAHRGKAPPRPGAPSR